METEDLNQTNEHTRTSKMLTREFVKSLDKDFIDNYPNSKNTKDIFEEILLNAREFDDISTNYNALIIELNHFDMAMRAIHDQFVEFYHHEDNIEGDIPVVLSKGITNIIFAAPHIHDSVGTNYRTRDLIQYNENKVDSAIYESRFTYLLYSVGNMINIFKNSEVDDNGKESLSEETTEKINKLKEFVRTICFDVINIGHPYILAKLFNAVFTKNDLNYKVIFDDSSLRNDIFENIVIRESIGISIHNGNKTDYDEEIPSEYSFLILSKAMNFDALTVAKDGYEWTKTILFRPEYAKSIKYIMTNALIDAINSDYAKIVDNEIAVSRYIRECITKWIKITPISNRPENPESFDYLDIPEILKYFWTKGKLIGLDKYESYDKCMDHYYELREPIEAEIAKLNDEIKWKKADEGAATDVSNLQKKVNDLELKLRPIKQEQFKIMKHKSLISFLFMECLSNEKIVDRAFNFELIYLILMNEPAKENAMFDTHNSLRSLVIKRDFKPAAVQSVNPYFMHVGQGDLASEDAKLMSTLLAATAHHQMASLVNMSSIRNYECMYLLINSIRDTMTRTSVALSDILFNYKLRYILFAESYDEERKNNKLKSVLEGIGEYYKDTSNGKISDTTTDDIDVYRSTLERMFVIYKQLISICKEHVKSGKRDIFYYLLNNDIRNIVKEFKDLIKTIESTKLYDIITGRCDIIDCPTTDKVNFDRYKFDICREIMLTARNTSEIYKIYEEFDRNYKKYVNSVSQMEWLLKNLVDNSTRASADEERKNNKPFKMFWPCITQYFYPIKDPDDEDLGEEAYEDDYMLTLTADDIKEENFGQERRKRRESRYKTTKACD